MYIYVNATTVSQKRYKFYTQRFFFCLHQINTNKASQSQLTKNQLCSENQYN